MNARQKAKHYKKKYDDLQSRIVPVYATYAVTKDAVFRGMNKIPAEKEIEEIKQLVLNDVKQNIEIKSFDRGMYYKVIGGVKIIK